VGGQAPERQLTGHRAWRLPLAVLDRLGRTIGVSVLSLAVMCGVWQGAITVFHLSSFVAKGPVEVYSFLFTSFAAASNRAELFSALGVTMRDAALGYVGGTAAAIAVALAVVTRRSVGQTVMPLAIALRSVPLVAMVPIITLVIGQGVVSVTVIAGIVTFFPTLVNVTQGLRSAPSSAADLFNAYGASELDVLRKARLPYALPAIFASARIAAPGALLGAILAEWLATGQGLGDLMVTSSSTANYSMLWAAVVAITTVSILLYNAVSAIERPVVARLGITAP
jgi:ABC-type nitrate/sulfonate/bicarbonate transport system permease component